MIKMLQKTILWMSALLLAVIFQARAEAQQSERSFAAEVGVTYNAERAKIASVPCGCFWLQGGSVDGAITIYRGIGAAVKVTGEHRSNAAPGVDLNKFALMAGPRYTHGISRWTSRYLGEKHTADVFGEALFGYVHGFNSVFPSQTGVQTSANAFSMQIGGGLNVNLARGFGLRALELGYVHSALPNSTSNRQNDFVVGIGITYRVGRR